VRVRVVLDGFGSMPMNSELIDEMVEAGVEVERFRQPVRWKYWEADHRTHRKILVVDSRVSFTGGVGIAEEWEGDARDSTEWRDTHFRIEGPASLGLRAAFLTDWRDTDHPLTAADIEVSRPDAAGEVPIAVIDGSAQIGLNHAERVIEALILAARQRIWIATPYFQPLPAVVDLLADAVGRGVDVQILVPGPHIDKRVSEIAAEDVYTPLVDEGVQVWVYQQTMMHVKAILVDGVMSLVGSVNFNRRSISKDEEVAAAILDEAVTYELERHFVLDRGVSEASRPDVKRKAHRVVAAKLLKPFSPEF
jgi:cardiolipin synthase